MRISDWSSDVCSSDLCTPARVFVPSWFSDGGQIHTLGVSLRAATHRIDPIVVRADGAAPGKSQARAYSGAARDQPQHRGQTVAWRRHSRKWYTPSHYGTPRRIK